MNEPVVERRKVYVVEFCDEWGSYAVITDSVERAIMLAKKDIRERTDGSPRVDKIERLRYRVIVDSA